MRESRIREIVREEIRRAFNNSGIELNEDTPKKGARVETPHGRGVVLTLIHPNVRVRLDNGNVMNVNRNKVVTRN